MKTKSFDEDDEETTLQEIGRPLLIGEKADHQVYTIGSAVNTAVVIASAEGILSGIDADIL